MSQFEGTWIPADLCKRKDLIPTEKLILGYCASFPNRCFASDAHIAAQLGLTQKTVSNTLSKLRARGILNGRDFKKSFTTIPVNGKPIPVNGHIEQSEEQRIDKREEFPLKGMIVKTHESQLTEEEIKSIRRHFVSIPCGPQLQRIIDISARKDAEQLSRAAV